MKYTHTLFLFLFSFYTAIGISQTVPDKEDLDYTIDWVGEPTYTSESTEVNEIIVESQFWELNLENEDHPNWRYSVSIDYYPSDYIHSDSTSWALEQFINSTQNSLFEDEHLELLSSAESDLSGYYGKDFRWKNKTDNQYFRLLVYVVENAVYQIGVNSKTGHDYNKDIEKFLFSLKLDDKLQGPVVSKTSEYSPSYMIDFPAEPSYTQKVIDSEQGKLTLNFMILEPPQSSENATYMASEINYADYDLDVSSRYKLDIFYIDAINGALNAVNGVLKSIKDIQYESKHGKEYEFYIAEGKMLIVYRLFLIEDIAYNLGVATTSDNLGNKSMISFLDSFRLK